MCDEQNFGLRSSLALRLCTIQLVAICLRNTRVHLTTHVDHTERFNNAPSEKIHKFHDFMPLLLELSEARDRGRLVALRGARAGASTLMDEFVVYVSAHSQRTSNCPTQTAQVLRLQRRGNVAINLVLCRA